MDPTSHPAAHEEPGWASRISTWITQSRPDVVVAGLLLLFAVVFNLHQLYPEVAIEAPVLNDGVLHRLAFERAASALAAGQDPTDPWLVPVVLGYPLFHLAHLFGGDNFFRILRLL